MPLNTIKQTSKLLLIEKFTDSDEATDLRTILANEDVPKDELFKLIQDSLEVRSFQEFVKKFMPVVWEWYERSDDPECPVNFCYSTEKPRGKDAKQIHLPEQEFYKLVMRLYESKSTSGESNLDFDYSEVADMLSPAGVMENVMLLRKDLEYNFRRYNALDSSQKHDKKRYSRAIGQIRDKIIDQYQQNFTGVIKLALADVENRLAIEDKTKPQGDMAIESSSNRACRIGLDDSGQLIMIPLLDDSGENVTDGVQEQEEDRIHHQIAEIVARDYDENVPVSENYIRGLIVNNYSAVDLLPAAIDREELVQKRDQYKSLYKRSQEQFTRAISSAVEKMLDVKVFFDHAALDGKDLKAPVIVANCKADALLMDNVKNKFRKLVASWGKEPQENRVWFAILPGIGDPDFLDEEADDEEEDLFAPRKKNQEEEATINTASGERLIGMGTVKEMLDILKIGKITTFFNYRANEITGFGKLTSGRIDQYRTKLGSLKGNEYAVFAYPNFTILPKKEGVIPIGKISRDGSEENEYIQVPGIYVDASYVAAGLVVASQNPDCLKKRGIPTAKNPANPCVRFDLEDRDNRFLMLTKMNRESGSLWDEDISENILRDGFGFSFCGNVAYYREHPVNNTYVYTARNMGQAGGKYKQICTRLTLDFIGQYLSLKYGNDGRVSEDGIMKFLAKEVHDWKMDADAEETAGVKNNILLSGEDIKFEDKKIHIRFQKVPEPMEIEIIEEE